MDTSMSAIEADGVVKRYRGSQQPALDGFTLDVPRGSVTALLGPNGAGKTTAVRILTTLMAMDEGRASVLGHDVQRDGHTVRHCVGLVGQYAAVDEILSGRRNLLLFGRLNGLPMAAARGRADELLTEFGLADAADRPVAKYSGGMRRRLDLAASLVTSPPVLFVDEPTSGLDPAGRRDLWNAVRRLVSDGTTVLLTTQYLDEADALADRVTILRDGRVVAEGSPAELKADIGDTWLDLTLATQDQLNRTAVLSAPYAVAPLREDVARTAVSVPVSGEAALVGLCAALAAEGILPLDIGIRKPSLDDVFLHFNPARTETAVSQPTP